MAEEPAGTPRGAPRVFSGKGRAIAAKDVPRQVMCVWLIHREFRATVDRLCVGLTYVKNW